jgi:hypothetical protein
MATVSRSVPPQNYPPGNTWWQKDLPGTQTYSRVTASLDCTGWTSLTTSKIEFRLQFSYDGGNTWRDVVGFMQNTLPPWGDPPTSIASASWQTPTPVNPTDMRGGIRVTGAAVDLGTLALEAS